MKHLKKSVPYFIIILIIAVLVFLPFPKRADVSTSSDAAPVIIIDAGHGGIDGGAVADDGTEEKHINLSVALEIEKILSSCGYSTVMTRTQDVSIHDSDAVTVREKKVSDLNNRLDIINKYPDAVFVSVHQNYFSDGKYYGTQVFYSENNPQSEILARSIQQSVVSALQPENTRQVRTTGDSVYLLKKAQCTAVMVECGFLSNREEAERLKTPEYQKQLAISVCDGITDYINKREAPTEEF